MTLNSSLANSIIGSTSATGTASLSTTASSTITSTQPLSDPLKSDSLLLSSSSSTTALDASPSPLNDTISTATNLGTLSGRVIQTGAVSGTDDLDFYRFQINPTSDLNLTLTGLSADADLYLIRDANGNGAIDAGEVLQSSRAAGSTSELIQLANLSPGTYFAAVQQYLGSTNYTLTLTSDAAGNTLADSRNLGVLNGSRSVADFVGSIDANDFYRFRLNNTSDFNLSLTGLTADADVYLVQDFNFNGTVDAGEVLAYSEFYGSTPEAISIQGLAAGDYNIWVRRFDGNTNYSLGLSATPADPGNTLGTAAELGVLNGRQVVTDSVSSSDPYDYYRFHLNTNSELRLDLTGLSSDADLYLIRDANSNGVIDAGEVLGRSILSGSQSELIQLNNLSAGTYFIQVSRFSGNTSYALTLTADAAGETLSSARNIGVLNSSRSYSDFVGSIDTSDFYRFQINSSSDLTLNLRGLAADADLFLIRDFNNNGLIDNGEVLRNSRLSGNTPESITLSGLAAGNYFVLVSQFAGNTNYTLDLAAQAVGGLSFLQGTLGADTFNVTSNAARVVISGNGNVDFGTGARDLLDLSGILSSSVSFNLLGINGGTGVAFDIGNGTQIFDAINFSNGRQILFEGIDRVLFADRAIDLSITPNDPLFNQQWNLHMMGVQNAWRFTTGSNSVAIGVQDTGLGVDIFGSVHPDLRTTNALVRSSNYQDDFFRNVPGQTGPRTNSHGTAVQGIIAAQSNNGIGISGINWNSSVFTADVLDSNPGDLPIAQATREMIDLAVSRGQRLVINLSLGGGPIDPALEQLVAQHQDNVLFVIAAGNENRNSLSNPASLAQRYSNVIAVGASWGRQDQFGNPKAPGTRISYPGSWGSNYGFGLSLMGPSEVVTTEATRNSATVVSFGIDPDFNGTSAAAPNVAGVASLVWSANPNLSAGQVQQVLAQTAYDLGVPGYDTTYGNGFVNADAAVRRAIALASGSA